jgi:lipoprotein-anchoring transpeptidase ErfK/SrfK
MVKRNPDIPPKTMPGGPKNPMGPRALYLYRDGRDLLYRIHGTLEPWTIGSNVSSGCIRLLPEDLIDLYDRVSTGTQVLVMKHLV